MVPQLWNERHSSVIRVEEYTNNNNNTTTTTTTTATTTTTNNNDNNNKTNDNSIMQHGTLYYLCEVNAHVCSSA